MKKFIRFLLLNAKFVLEISILLNESICFFSPTICNQLLSNHFSVLLAFFHQLTYADNEVLWGTYSTYWEVPVQNFVLFCFQIKDVLIKLEMNQLYHSIAFTFHEFVVVCRIFYFILVH